MAPQHQGWCGKIQTVTTTAIGLAYFEIPFLRRPLLDLWARGYVEALFAEGLIDWDEHGRLNAAVDDQCDRRRGELKAAGVTPRYE